MPIRSVASDPDIEIGVSGPFMVVNSRGTSTPHTIELLTTVQDQLVKNHGQIISLIAMTSPMQRSNDEATRKEAIEMTHRYEKVTTAAAFVVVSKGLASVIVRTFLTGYFLFSKSTIPQKVFNNLGDALTWLREMPEAASALAEPDLEQQIHNFLSSPARTET